MNLRGGIRDLHPKRVLANLVMDNLVALALDEEMEANCLEGIADLLVIVLLRRHLSNRRQGPAHGMAGKCLCIIGMALGTSRRSHVLHVRAYVLEICLVPDAGVAVVVCRHRERSRS